MRATLRKWGNSTAVRIPKEVLRSSRMIVDESVEVREEDGRIVIEPVRQKAYHLRDLIDAITPENQHELVDFGPPQGKEVW